MLAERKRERRQGRLGDRIIGGSKGKGLSKGKWSNHGHTWDSSWHHSSWHGKTYGLVVDPWTAVEHVPNLCAVSLNSSCDEFSEPNHTSRGTLTKSSKFGSPKDFAHLNKFSILAPDDDECCASKTRRGFSVNNGGTMRQKFPVTDYPLHRS